MKPRITIALSGGGFRASIFHLGLLLRLAELGWLPDVDVFSTVSGGSIVGAFAVQRWASFLAAGGDVIAYRRIILEPFLQRLREHNLILRWLAGGWEWPIRKCRSGAFTRTEAAADLLDEWYFGGANCASLPARPLLILNATNLQSIRAWRFTHGGMGDSRVGHAAWGSNPLKLSTCVGASAAFPPVFPPLRITRADYTFSGPIYPREEALQPYPLIPLTDGGVYDNSGLEAVTKSVRLPGLDEMVEPAELLVVSDGGAPTIHGFDASGIPALADAALLYRVDSIARQQVSALRTRELMDSFVKGKRSGVFVRLSSSVDRLPSLMYEDYCSEVSEAHQIPKQIRSRLERVRTSLDRFQGIEVEALMYHAYAMTAAFTWCHRSVFPVQYQQLNLRGAWTIEFDAERIAEWDRELAKSSKAFWMR